MKAKAVDKLIFSIIFFSLLLVVFAFFQHTVIARAKSEAIQGFDCWIASLRSQ
jgi:hypothetical protein